VVGLAAVHGAPAYDYFGAEGALSQTVFSGAAHIPEANLTALLRSFVLPLLRHCPPQHYPTVIQQTCGLFQVIYNRISPRWKEVAQRANPGIPDPSGGGGGGLQFGGEGRRSPGAGEASQVERDEIAADTRLRDLTRELLNTVSAMLGSPPADQIAPDACPPELGQYLIQRDECVGPVLLLTIAAVEWPDKMTERTAHRAGRCIVSLFASQQASLTPQIHEALSHLVGGDLLKAALRAVLLAGKRMHGDFDGCMLVRDIYCRLAQVCRQPRQVFSSLSPKCTQEKLLAFEKKVAATKEKAQRSVFRDLLLELELSEEMQRKKIKRVDTLPQSFMVLGTMLERSKSNEEMAKEGEGVSALFWSRDEADL